MEEMTADKLEQVVRKYCGFPSEGNEPMWVVIKQWVYGTMSGVSDREDVIKWVLFQFLSDSRNYPKSAQSTSTGGE